MRLQKKRDSSYNGDHYLRDKLINTVETTRILEALHFKIAPVIAESRQPDR